MSVSLGPIKRLQIIVEPLTSFLWSIGLCKICKNFPQIWFLMAMTSSCIVKLHQKIITWFTLLIVSPPYACFKIGGIVQKCYSQQLFKWVYLNSSTIGAKHMRIVWGEHSAIEFAGMLLVDFTCYYYLCNDPFHHEPARFLSWQNFQSDWVSLVSAEIN